MESCSVPESWNGCRNRELRCYQSVVGCSTTDPVRAEICLLEKSRFVIAQSDKGLGDANLKCIVRIRYFSILLRRFHASSAFTLGATAIWANITAGNGLHTSCYSDHS